MVKHNYLYIAILLVTLLSFTPKNIFGIEIKTDRLLQAASINKGFVEMLMLENLDEWKIRCPNDKFSISVEYDEVYYRGYIIHTYEAPTINTPVLIINFYLLSMLGLIIYLDYTIHFQTNNIKKEIK